MEATGLRMTPVVVPAAGVAALIAWSLRDHAEFLPSGDLVRRSLAALGASGHHGTGSGYGDPPAVAGEALASYAGLTVFALHVLMIAVAAAGYGMRRWNRWSTVDSPGVLVRLTFACAVAVVSAVVTAGMATVLLGTAISSTATLATSITVLQNSFVLVRVFSMAFGVP
ncbi:MAG: hypothetical protein M3443_07445 [Actinomycetota bacterium]|nr:hypothetical protein [Actinomycetota bacterium]